jgi:hypothetical protein
MPEGGEETRDNLDLPPRSHIKGYYKFQFAEDILKAIIGLYVLIAISAIITAWISYLDSSRDPLHIAATVAIFLGIFIFYAIKSKYDLSERDLIYYWVSELEDEVKSESPDASKIQSIVKKLDSRLNGYDRGIRDNYLILLETLVENLKELEQSEIQEALQTPVDQKEINIIELFSQEIPDTNSEELKEAIEHIRKEYNIKDDFLERHISNLNFRHSTWMIVLYVATAIVAGVLVVLKGIEEAGIIGVVLPLLDGLQKYVRRHPQLPFEE